MESKILSVRLRKLCKDPLTYLVEAGAHIQQQDIYIEFLEYAFSGESRYEVYTPKHSVSCKEYYIKGISLGAPNGRFEWNCTVDCPTNGISLPVTGSYIEQEVEEEEE